jgi:predicted dehydrogenase
VPILLSSLPQSRVPDPQEAPVLRWAVLGAGGIARQFTRALRLHTRQQVVAVGSRSMQRAQQFAGEFEIERPYGSYEQLVADRSIDIVYVATPHSEHRENALLAIAAGRHVLVEKAFTRNAAEAREVFGAARSADVTVMEAMWTRFLPHMDVVRRLLEDGALGSVQAVSADHGQWFATDPAHRLFAPSLAGGALLDLGIYPISFAHFVLGRPDSITAVGDLTETGVDRQTSIILRAGRAQASLNTTLAAVTPTTAAIAGADALLEIPGDFYQPAPLTVTSRGGSRLSRALDPITGHEGLCFQAAHLATLVADGRRESPLLPPAETVSVLETIDEIRRQVGFVLPGE